MDMPMKKECTVAFQAAARGTLPELAKALLDEWSKVRSDDAERSAGSDAGVQRGSH